MVRLCRPVPKRLALHLPLNLGACVWSFLAASAVVLVAATSSHAAPAVEARTALIIGNSGYASTPLLNPRNDARDLAAVLRRLGFEVEVLIDQNKEG